ncbi:MAG: hypothetical protein ACM338_06130, partial [Betaproteobacteria bacterium]
IGAAWYWDGGLASNSPLWYVLDEGRDLNALVFQIDLFSARGAVPHSIDEVLERSKDIQYSSKTRFNTSRAKDDEELRGAMRRPIEKLPAHLRPPALPRGGTRGFRQAADPRSSDRLPRGSAA